jgi:hypothetical protein
MWKIEVKKKTPVADLQFCYELMGKGWRALNKLMAKIEFGQ